LHNNHDGRVRKINNSLKSTDPLNLYYRFALTRDPVKRFLSMYSNRVLHHKELSQRSKAATNIIEAGLDYQPSINYLIKNLDAYLNASSSIRHHSLPMMNWLGPELGVFSRLVDISESNVIINEICLFWQSNGIMDVNRSLPVLGRKQTGGPKLNLNVLKPDSFEILLEYYRCDYEEVPTVNIQNIKAEYMASRSILLPPAVITSAPKAKERNIFLSSKPAWLLEYRLEQAREVNSIGQAFDLTGVVVLGPDAPPHAKLAVIIGDKENSVKWGIKSPYMAKKYVQVPQAGRARFQALAAIPVTSDVPIYFVLRWPGSEFVLAELMSWSESNRQLDVLLDDVRKWSAIRPIESEMGDTFLARLNALKLQCGNDYRWLKASILSYANLQINGKQAFSLFEQLAKQLGSAGVAEINHFHGEIRALIEPKTLGPHGFHLAVENRLVLDQLQHLRMFIHTVEQLGYDWFANSGTLLGLIREGKLIAHDDDLDFGLVLKAKDLEAANQEKGVLSQKFKRLGCPLRILDNGKLWHWKLFNASYIDIFPAWIDVNNKLYVWPHTCGELTIDDLYPMRKITLGEVDFPVPHHSDRMLNINYGSTWQKPNPAWSFDWQGATRKFLAAYP